MLEQMREQFVTDAVQAQMDRLFCTFNSDDVQKRELPPIYTADLETDPFEHGKMIEPFAAGFYNGAETSIFWGSDCIEKFFAHLLTVDAGIIYVHNFGGFDFFWMLNYLQGESVIRNGRIVRTYCKARGGKVHELRDSYAILPIKLRDYKVSGVSRKLDISIDKLKRSVRAKHRAEICEYLRMDCVSLHELVMLFIDRFGPFLTIGSTAMTQLKEVHDFICIDTPEEDELIRSQFYYGGRVQCFKGGIQKGNFKVYDVNSMYPYVMKNYLHPIGLLTNRTKKITKNTAFVLVEGENFGAFPYREEDGSLNFTRKSGIFGVTIHEYRIAKQYGLFKTRRIIAAYNYNLQRSFANFVDKFYKLRKAAKESGDDVHSTFYKLILNSSYGKFAQDSSKYFDYRIEPIEKNLSTPDADGCIMCAEDTCILHWRPDNIVDTCKITIWKRNNPRPVFYNVATGCSITGAARAVLLEAICKAQRPIYCDTDSIICEGLPGVKLSNSELGAWKLEGEGDTAAIAGKKLYALFKGRKAVKVANKGVDIEPKDIRYLAQNPAHEITYYKESPTFKVSGTYSFLHRTVRATTQFDD